MTVSSTNGPACEVAGDDTVFLVTYILLGISICVTLALLVLVMFGIRYKIKLK